jgi:hypothetical protein
MVASEAALQTAYLPSPLQNYLMDSGFAAASGGC